MSPIHPRRFVLVVALVLGVGLAGVAIAQVAPAPRAPSCPTHDCIAHSLATQVTCTEETQRPVGRRTAWEAGLSTNTDQRMLGGKIAAYRIRWSNGAWSTWYVPGHNDIDTKYNVRTNDMRRMWAYFGDHEHRFIICR